MFCFVFSASCWLRTLCRGGLLAAAAGASGFLRESVGFSGVNVPTAWIGFPLRLPNAPPRRPTAAQLWGFLTVPPPAESVVFCFSVVGVGAIQWAPALKVLSALE